MLPRSVALVNCVLMLHADIPLPASDIGRAAGVAYTSTVSALATLEKRGLAHRTRRGGRDVFGPNTQSVYYPMAYATALVDFPLTDALRGQRVYGVYAYGSMTHSGGGTRASDLDLLIVGDVKDRAAMAEQLAKVGARLNRIVDPLILSPEQLEQGKVGRDPHVIAALAGVRMMGRV